MTDKYCINCIHFWIEDGRPDEYALCKRIERPRSLVTGLHEGEAYPYCSVARESPCGVSARFYEPKDIPVTQEEDEAFEQLKENKHV